MKPEGWKSFPTPNPWFAPPVSPSPRALWLERFASGFLWLSWIAFLGGALGTPIVLLFSTDREAVNHPLRIMILAWFALFPALWLYARVMSRRVLRERDIIPGYTEDTLPGCLFLVFVSIPVCIVGLVTGLVFAIVIYLERKGREKIAVEFMHNGRIRRRMMLVQKSAPEQLKDEEIVWITRPRLFVPPQPVNRHGTPGILDHATIAGKDWLWDAFERAENRRDRKRSIKRRAKSITRIRRERGRSDAYTKKL